MIKRKVYMFSLEVRSIDCLLAALTVAVGQEPAATSHSIGDVRFRKDTWPISSYKYEIGTFEECDVSDGWAKVDQACASLSDGFKRALELSANNRVVLNIGIISDTLSISVCVPEYVIKTIATDGIGLEVAAYLADSGK